MITTFLILDPSAFSQSASCAFHLNKIFEKTLKQDQISFVNELKKSKEFLLIMGKEK